MRVKATIAYDGSRFFGFQSQKSTKNTVATSLQIALNSLNIDSKIVASGRTDRGVHATNQVIHFDLPSYWQDFKKLKEHLNQRLFPAIIIKKIEPAFDNFHARFSAKKRAYRYILSTKEPNPFEANYITFVKDIDFKKIEDSINLFKGKHDFRFFQKSANNANSSIREIYRAKVYRFKEYIIIYFEANGFLRSQIRMMVDFLLKIGKSRLTKAELKEQLLCKKQYSSTLSPPYGLYLCRVVY
ncbi:MAG TPA: tRNA pseudouridine(38-40) synthase TruA [Campylobacterales bacterium]|nr:tRNA pseudouridine(38-40) synthase TruA [Campylobacterales bacterium]